MALPQALRREGIYITSILRTLHRLRHVAPDSTETITDIVEGFARRTPHAPAVLHEDEIVSYAALDTAANRYANWAIAQGIAKGDCVSLLMENRPEYLMAWLGLLKIGAIAALINTNLRGAPLAHSLNIANAEHVILGAELGDAYAEVASTLEGLPTAWATGGTGPGAKDLDAALAAVSANPPGPSIRKGLTCKDKAFYIFTSGTTGLPKAANITHLRLLFMMYGFAGGLNSKPGDRIYCPLPLYHSSGGICAVGIALTAGGSIVLRRRFSAHEFWDDCFRYKPNFFQYIGELCRYLLNAPPHAHERDHNLRIIVGNGLRPEIWPAFQARFAIPRIIEFYGATEGNVSMLNYDGHVGAVGRVPDYMRWRFKFRIIRFDVEKESPVRRSNGFCIECVDDEAGEALGQIENDPGQTFDGYTRAEDTNKKILRDVFTKGDAWFRTGDLMRRDAHGYFYFVDRIGDTFRWKGENVATSEVAEALGIIPGILEANVYGVAVPGMDGRAGMAALVAGPGFDAAILAGKLAGNLPHYARPVFLRLTPQMEITGTFKQRKVDLVQEGFDPARIIDPLFVFDAASGRYIALDRDRYNDIVSGRMKL
ncbi:MAG TPA: long-chain-acyl-CoA synthetase [Rhizomicrobium sp.]|jgi:fatty-acyl-CoA synthase|nr:long-chain-acyl-CoA synthetase [Rhizomicrobium sp.]